MAVRGTPTTITHPSNIGEKDYATDVNEEVKEIWKKIANWLSSVAGTNAITATATPTLDAYAQPMAFWLVPVADNTGGVTINIDARGVKDVKDSEGNTLTGGDLKTGRMVLLIYDGVNFRVFSGEGGGESLLPAPDMLIRDEKSSTTDGGTFTNAAWRTRDLNTVVRNLLSGASLAGNAFTLQAGSYYIEWMAPAFRVDGHQSRLRNITDGTTVESSGSASAPSGSQVTVSPSLGEAIITITSAKQFTIEHQGTTTFLTQGFGVAAGGFAAKEVYTTVKIWKLQLLETSVVGRHGGAITLTYDYNDTIIPGDPGSGILRFNNLTFTAGVSPTKIFVDQIGSNLSDYGLTLNSVQGGQGRVVKADDPTKWAIFDITGNTDQTGWFELDIVLIEASSASPFADTDPLVFAMGSPGAAALVTGTSNTSTPIGTGSKVFTTQSDRQWSVGERLRLASLADVNNFMEGPITAYTGTSLTVNVDLVGGSGTFTDWQIGISGEPGTVAVSGSPVVDNALPKFSGTTGNIIEEAGVIVDDLNNITGVNDLTLLSDLFLPSGSVINFNAGDVTITHAADQLNFQGATTGYFFQNGPVSPLSDNGSALGGVTNRWSDLFLASGAVINFDAGDVTITHSVGALSVNSDLFAKTSDGALLTLQTSLNAVVDGSILGRINFQAPDEADGLDSILVAASIYAEADNTFSATVNETDLVFALGASEAAVEVARLTHGGELGLGTPTPAQLLEISKSQNASTIARVTNSNAGASATAGFEASTDAGLFDLFASSTAGGSDVFFRWDGPGLMVFSANNAAGTMRFDTNASTGQAELSTAALRLGMLGTSSFPAYSFVNDSNTGIYSPAADQISMATGGAQNMVLLDGNDNFCTFKSIANANKRFSVTNTDAGGNAAAVIRATTNAGNFDIICSSAAAGSVAIFRWSGSGGTFFNHNNASGTMGFQIANSNKMQITNAGEIQMVGGGTETLPKIGLSTDTNTGLIWPAADTFAEVAGGKERRRIAVDIHNVLKSTEAASIDIETASQELTGLTGASVTTTGLIPAGSRLLGIVVRVTTTITGPTTFDIGGMIAEGFAVDDVDRFGASIAPAVGTQTTETSYTADPEDFDTGARNIRLTANGSNFTAGAVRVTAFYLTFTAPTS